MDVLARFFSIINHTNDNSTLFVLLVEYYEEFIIIQKILSELDYTVVSNKNSLLRQIEHVYIKKNKNVFVSTINRSRNILAAARELQIPVEFIIESAPIHKWRILYQGESIDRTNTIISNDIVDDNDASKFDEDPGVEENLVISKSLVSDDLYEWGNYLTTSIRNWLNELFNNSSEIILPHILDSRLGQEFINKNAALTFKELPFLNLSDKDRIKMNNYADEFAEIERKEAPVDYDDYQKFLSQNWGYNNFKETQREPIKSIIPNDKDVIVRLPTGEGKSIIFQVPALLRGFYTKRLTIVVSPLRALMTDQVERLWNEGFTLDVDYLSGDREAWENNEVYQHIVDGQVKLLFVAPERFRVKKFREAILRRYQEDEGFEYIVIDEAHCISQWGFEFRPDYLYCISEIIREFRTDIVQNHFSFIFLSATITDATLDDIKQIAKLDTDEKALVIVPENMPNPIRDFINISCTQVGSGLYDDDGIAGRISFIEETIKTADPSQSAVLLFCTRRAHTEELERSLSEKKMVVNNTNIVTRSFHAGHPVSERLEVYEELKESKTHVLAATKAFGMGMDISNLHWCVHLGPPNYFEDYLQEVGRTGRDEERRKAAGLEDINCQLLFHPNDFERTRTLIQRSKITLPDLSELFNFIVEDARDIDITGEKISVIPNTGLGSLKGDRFRKGLFWLEKSERIEILGKLPNIIKIKVRLKLLQNAAVGENNSAKVAKSIIKLFDRPQSDTTPKTNSSIKDQKSESSAGIVKKAFNLLARTVGIVFQTKNIALRESNNNIDDSPEYLSNIFEEVNPNIDAELEVDLNLAALFQDSGLLHIDEAFSALGVLEENRCLKITHILEFKRERYLQVEKFMWDWLKSLIENYLIPTNGHNIKLDEEQLSVLLVLKENEEDLWPVKNERYIQGAQKRCIRSFIRLLKYANIKVRKELDENNKPVFVFRISKKHIDYAKEKISTVIKISKKVTQSLMNTGNGDIKIDLGNILKEISSIKNYKIFELQSALRLISGLGFFSLQNSLLPWSYILFVKNTTPFPNGIDENISELDRESIETLQRTNRSAELRSFAFEIFSLTPSDSSREFINEYFKISDIEDFERFIVRKAEDLVQLNEKLEGQLEEIKRQVRQEAFTEQFETLSDKQKDICRTPYARTILVNAGPGSGKTRVLIMRAAQLIHEQGLKPENILILAFNRAVVFEIRSRITDLFRQLGYGSYVSRIKVYTFHSFAIKYMFDNQVDTDFEDNLHLFTEEIVKNDDLAQSVTMDVRCILVDEFQDMNEDFYKLIIRLKEISNSGIMVIGDDDQDILLWNRLKWAKNYGKTRKHAYEYFKDFEEIFPDLVKKDLLTNYRSVISVVDRSQKLLAHNVFTEKREKEKIELVPNSLENGIVEQKKIKEFSNKIDEIWKEKGNDKSLAILCRTNSNCYKVAEILDKQHIAHNIVGDNDYYLERTRSIGSWIDSCREYIIDLEESIMLNDKHFENIQEIFRRLHIPDSDFEIKQLWDFTIEENPRATLDDHIKFLLATKKSDLMRMLKNNQSDKILISTINKVKGLEFDIVYLKSSQSKFPLSFENNVNINDFSLEEFRLWYVGITRAKESLYFEWGDREKSWQKAINFAETDFNNGLILSGTYDEIFLSGAAQEDNDVQDYIEHHVKIGDRMTKEDDILLHNNQKISKLASKINNKARGLSNTNLQVSDVLRYPVDEEKAKKYKVAQKYIDKGWYYVVLVKGKID